MFIVDKFYQTKRSKDTGNSYFGWQVLVLFLRLMIKVFFMAWFFFHLTNLRDFWSSRIKYNPMENDIHIRFDSCQMQLSKIDTRCQSFHLCFRRCKRHVTRLVRWVFNNEKLNFLSQFLRLLSQGKCTKGYPSVYPLGTLMWYWI